MIKEIMLSSVLLLGNSYSFIINKNYKNFDNLNISEYWANPYFNNSDREIGSYDREVGTYYDMINSNINVYNFLNSVDSSFYGDFDIRLNVKLLPNEITFNLLHVSFYDNEFALYSDDFSILEIDMSEEGSELIYNYSSDLTRNNVIQLLDNNISYLSERGQYVIKFVDSFFSMNSGSISFKNGIDYSFIVGALRKDTNLFNYSIDLSNVIHYTDLGDIFILYKGYLYNGIGYKVRKLVGVNNNTIVDNVTYDALVHENFTNWEYFNRGGNAEDIQLVRNNTSFVIDSLYLHRIDGSDFLLAQLKNGDEYYNPWVGGIDNSVNFNFLNNMDLVNSRENAYVIAMNKKAKYESIVEPNYYYDLSDIVSSVVKYSNLPSLYITSSDYFDETSNNDVFSIIDSSIAGFSNLLDIKILPFITIGGILLIPLIAVIVIILIRLVAK